MTKALFRNAVGTALAIGAAMGSLALSGTITASTSTPKLAPAAPSASGGTTPVTPLNGSPYTSRAALAAAGLRPATTTSGPVSAKSDPIPAGVPASQVWPGFTLSASAIAADEQNSAQASKEAAASAAASSPGARGSLP